MTNQRTTMLPAHVVAAVWPELAPRQPDSAVPMQTWICDQITKHEARRGHSTTQELPAVDFGENSEPSTVLGIMDNSNQVAS